MLDNNEGEFVISQYTEEFPNSVEAIGNDTVTYSENNLDEPGEMIYVEPVSELDNEDDIVSFSENELGSHEDSRVKLPGSESFADDMEDEGEEEDNTDWPKDRNVKKFMVYILDTYPSKIPKHDGKSIVAIERAISFLNRINKEISEAVRKDTEGCLDVDKLEDIRKNIYKDVNLLKQHIKKMEEKLKKQSSESVEFLSKEAELKKEATTPKIQMVMTPFERAISGMIINAVVSAGHPIDDVFDALKDKYKLTDREELSILQLLMDMGFPIYKDRGTLGDDSKAVDFAKNYFS